MRSAVLALIARSPRTISLIRRGGTLISLANRYWLMPSGARNSSWRISPGWIGLIVRRTSGPPLSMIVHDLDFMRVAILPAKANPPLVVHANTVFARPVAVEFLQPVPRWHAQVSKRFRGVQNQQPSQGGPANGLGELGPPLPEEDAFGLLVAETYDHRAYLSALR